MADRSEVDFVSGCRARGGVERALQDLRVACREGAKDDLGRIVIGGKFRHERVDRDPGGAVLRETVDAGRDRREGNGTAAVLPGERQRVAVAGSEHLVLPLPAAVPDRAHGVDDVARLQRVTAGDPRLTRRAAAERPAFFQQARPRRTVDRPVNPAAADGLFYGNPSQFLIQAAAAGIAILFAFGMTYLLARVLKAVVGLRVSSNEEEVGLDISEHGEPAYA